jgi:hypothetical protein
MAAAAAALESSSGGGSSYGGHSAGYGSQSHGVLFAAGTGSTAPTSAASSDAGDWEQQQQHGLGAHDKLSEAGPQHSPRSGLQLYPISTTPAGG